MPQPARVGTSHNVLSGPFGTRGGFVMARLIGSGILPQSRLSTKNKSGSGERTPVSVCYSLPAREPCSDISEIRSGPLAQLFVPSVATIAIRGGTMTFLGFALSAV